MKNYGTIYLLGVISALVIMLIYFIGCDSSEITSPQSRYEVIFNLTYNIDEMSATACDVIELSTGDLLVAGSSALSGLLLEINNDGEVIWSKTYVGGWFKSVIETNEGGFAATGGNGNGAYVVRTDQVGNILWEQSIVVPYSIDARKIIQTYNGDYLIPVNSNDVRGNARLVRLSSSGNFKWTKIIESDLRTLLYSINENSDSSITLIEVDKTDSLISNVFACWLLTMDSNGNEISKRLINEDISSIGNSHYEYPAILNNSGEYTAVGNNNFFSINLDGEVIFKNSIPPPYGFEGLKLNSIAQHKNNSYVAAGSQWYLVENKSTHALEPVSFGVLFILNSAGGLLENVLLDNKCFNNSLTSVMLSRDNTIVTTGIYHPCEEEKQKAWITKIRLL